MNKNFIAAILALGFCAIMPLMAATETVGGYTWTYQINGNTAEIYNNRSVAVSPEPLGGVVIPSMLGGKSVTRIGWNAFDNCTNLTSVIIPEGVTSIGGCAFIGCSSLTNVTIPRSVTQIESWTFCGCIALKDVVILGNVTCIEVDVFRWCPNLLNVKLPDGLRTIRTEAFCECYSLTNIVIPATVTAIEPRAFDRCQSLKEICIPSGVRKISDNAFAFCHGLTNIVLSVGLVSIESNAFYQCSNLKSLAIPSGVTSVGDNSFYGCSGMETLSIPASLTDIGIDAFKDCNGLRTIVVDSGNLSYKSEDGLLLTKDGKEIVLATTGMECIVIPSGVESIPDYAFQNYTGLRLVSIPSSVTNIGRYAFSGCSSLTNVSMSAGVETIGVRAFASCRQLKDVEIPSSVASVGDYAFYSCSMLTNVVMESGVMDIGNNVFYNCSRLKDVTIPSSVTNIGENVFYRCNNLSCDTNTVAGVKLVDGWAIGTTGTIAGNLDLTGIRGIAAASFKDCVALISVFIPPTVSGIGTAAFSGCTSLSFAYVPNTFSGMTAGRFDSSTELVFYKPVQTVSLNANGGSVSPVSVERDYRAQYGTLPVPTRHGYTFDGWALDGELVSANTMVEKLDDHVLVAQWTDNRCTVAFDANGGVGGTVYQMESGTVIGELPVPTLDRYEFMGWFTEREGGERLTEAAVVYGNMTVYARWGVPSYITGTYTDESRVTFEYFVSNGRLTIGTRNEYSSAILNSTQGNIVVPSFIDGYPVTRIGDYAFYGCQQLYNVTLPEGIVEIGEQAFRSCDMAGINIPSTVRKIGPMAFAYSDIWSPEIPEGVMEIPEGAFYYCRRLYDVIIPSTVTNIGTAAFRNTPLRSATIPASVKSIEDRAFNFCIDMTNLTFEGEMPRIGKAAFKECDGLANESGLVIVGDILFDAPLHGSVVVPNGVKEISSYAFYPETIYRIEHFTPGHFEQHNTYGYYGSSTNSTVTSVIIPYGVTNIADHAFYCCRRLASVGLPSTLEGIGDSAFSVCQSLSSISLPYGLKSIGEYALSGTPIMNMVVPATVVEMGGSTFWQCYSLSAVTLPDSLTELPWNMFYGCTNLNSIAIPPAVTNIGGRAFYNCSSLADISIPQGVMDIGPNAFYGTPYLANLMNAQSSGLVVVNGCLIGVVGKTCPAHVVMEDYGIRAVSQQAFNDATNRFTVKWPTYMTRIPDSTFYNCRNLVGIEIPDSVMEIGESAFLGAGIQSLTTAADRIAPFAFCSSGLKDVFLKEGVSVVGSNAFYGCSGMTNVIIPASMKEIGASAFRIGASSYTHYGVSRVKITDLGAWCGIAFGDEYANPVGRSTGVLSADGTLLTTLDIPLGPKTIKPYAFTYFAGITSVTIPYGVTNVGFYSFAYCNALTSMHFPSTLKVIQNQFASRWSDSPVLRLVFDGDAPAYYDYTFDSINQSRCIIYVPHGSSGWETEIPGKWKGMDIRYIGDPAVLDESKLPVVSPAETMFYNCVTVTVSAAGARDKVYYTTDGSIPTTNSTCYQRGVGITNSTLFKFIAVDYATGDYSPVLEVRYEKSPLSIDARYSTVSIVSCDKGYEGEIDIPATIKGKPVTQISLNAFKGCTNLTAVTIPSSIADIGSYAFSGCVNLRDVTIPQGVVSIGDYAFYGCMNLKDITIPSSVTSIGYYVFSRGTTLHVDDLLTWCRISFDNYPNIAGLYVGGKPLEGELVIPAGVSNISAYAFSCCTNLTAVEIPEGVTYIGQYAFADTKIKQAILPSTLKAYDLEAFGNLYNYQSELKTLIFTGRCPVLTIDGCSFGGEWDWENFGIKYMYSLGNGPTIFVPYSTRNTGWTTNLCYRETYWQQNYGYDGYGYYEYEVTNTVYVFNPYVLNTSSRGDGTLSIDKFEGYGYSEWDNRWYSTSFDLAYLEIPSKWNGKTVTAIGDNACEGLWVDKIIIPATIDSIGRHGLRLWYDTAVFCGNAPTSLGDYPFSNETTGNTIIVPRESTGWEVPIPGTWQGQSIQYDTAGYDESFVVTASPTDGAAFIGTTNITLSARDGLTIHYTLDGTVPTRQSSVYSSPIRITGLTTIMCYAVDEYGIGWGPTLRVEYTPCYAVTFDANNGIVDGLSSCIRYVASGSSIDTLPVPIREGYDFDGWYTAKSGGSRIYSYTSVYGDRTYYAHWQKLYYSVVFALDDRSTRTGGGEVEQSVPYQAAAVGPEVTVNEGWVFLGWDADFGCVESNMTVHALYERAPLTIAEAAGGDLAFTTGGAVEWFAEWSESAHDGRHHLRSGAIGNKQASDLSAVVQGAGTVSFWCKVSSEADEDEVYDGLSFYADGVNLTPNQIGGELGWTNLTFEISGAGAHTLCWRYEKDKRDAAGEDCAWVDCVIWTPSGTTVDVGGGKTVTVPGTWLSERTDRAATDTAANGRKVWECYLLGVDPERADDDFKITRFWMDGDKPMFEFSHTRDGSGVSFEPRIRRMGKAALGDAWQEVPAGGNPAFRFFTVEVEPPR